MKYSLTKSTANRQASIEMYVDTNKQDEMKMSVNKTKSDLDQKCQEHTTINQQLIKDTKTDQTNRQANQRRNDSISRSIKISSKLSRFRVNDWVRWPRNAFSIKRISKED
jgi:septal ring factor EnvC (AmiA/AmiB activator)